MNLILLPGNSVHNKVWIEEVENELKELFGETKIQYYAHWKTGKNIDENCEVAALTKIANTFGEYIIFAKSIGTYFVLRAITKNRMKPNKIIFLGFPYRTFLEEGSDEEIKMVLNTINVPILFIQNSTDPFCSYQELINFLKKTKLKGYQTYEFKSTETHDYRNYKKLKELVSNFCQRNTLKNNSA